MIAPVVTIAVFALISWMIFGVSPVGVFAFIVITGGIWVLQSAILNRVFGEKADVLHFGLLSGIPPILIAAFVISKSGLF